MDSIHEAEGVIRVLLVEDDLKLAQLTAQYLERKGMVVTHATTRPDGLALARRQRFDVVLLDVMLPGRSGLEVCQALRQTSDVPIIVVSAREEEADRVLGLEMGADDYVSKPFSARELTARIQAQVRRARGRLASERRTLLVGKLAIDVASRSATLDQQPLNLTTYEFELLRVLAERAGRVLSREQLLDLAKGSAEAAFDRTIDVHISRLRQKLGDDPRQPRLLKTVRGVGYLLATGNEP